MKAKIFLMPVILTAIILSSCNKPNPVNTIENLKAAYNGESTASAKYAAFADQAALDSLDAIATMFRATSRAEAIHADNHKKVIEKLGVEIGDPEIGTFSALSTAENLQDAIDGESYEITTMYPGFISTAEQEKADKAKKSFTWALDTEKKHQVFYQAALDVINAGMGIGELPLKWWVCPVCGNTYDDATVSHECDFCKTKKDKSEIFE